jgi:tryptophan-rich sensory protein
MDVNTDTYICDENGINTNQKYKFINIEIISILFIVIVILIIEHFILVSSEHNPKFVALNKPDSKLSIKTTEVIWIIVAILKVISWYIAKRDSATIRKYISVDLLLMTSITFGLFYVYMFYVEVNLKASLIILILAFLFSLYYLYYMFRIDGVSGFISIILSIWLLILIKITYDYIKINP